MDQKPRTLPWKPHLNQQFYTTGTPPCTSPCLSSYPKINRWNEVWGKHSKIVYRTLNTIPDYTQKRISYRVRVNVFNTQPTSHSVRRESRLTRCHDKSSRERNTYVRLYLSRNCHIRSRPLYHFSLTPLSKYYRKHKIPVINFLKIFCRWVSVIKGMETETDW